jgi:uncharacterized membrane protein YgdD (TMEM256/DUF423 family)
MPARAGSDVVRRVLAAAGAVCCASAVAWGAYSAHGIDAALRPRADSAMLVMLVHGLALTLLAPRQSARLELFALLGWFAGIVLFSGSLMLSITHDTPTRLAPFGGMLLIGAWLVHALAALRRRD